MKFLSTSNFHRPEFELSMLHLKAKTIGRLLCFLSVQKSSHPGGREGVAFSEYVREGFDSDVVISMASPLKFVKLAIDNIHFVTIISTK
jgi:hypothetical protein